MKSRKLLLGLAVFFLVGAFAPMKASPVSATEGEEGSETVAPKGWVSVGPNNVAGRVRALVYDRNTDGVMYAGTVGGGLFVSQNGGNSWTEIDFSNGECYAVTALAQDEEGNLYIGTGEGYYSDEYIGQNNKKSGILGKGLYKYNPATGESILIEGTQPVAYDVFDEYAFINDLAWANGKLYIATKNGGLKVWNGSGAPSSVSIDGNNAVPVTDIKVNRNGDIAVAYDAGNTFQVALCKQGEEIFKVIFDAPSEEEIYGRIELAFAPKNNNMLYALVSNRGYVNNEARGNLNGVYKADITPNDVVFGTKMTPNTLSMGVFLNEAMSIAVNDLEEEYIYLGGDNLYRLFNANGENPFYAEQLTSYTGQLTSGSYVAPGIHTILFDETPQTLADSMNIYVSTDAGVFKFAEDMDQTLGYTWRPLNRGLNSGQYYNVAVGADGSVMGASQSNAFSYIPNPSLDEQKSADVVWSIMNQGFDMTVIQAGRPDQQSPLSYFAPSESAQSGSNVMGSAIHRTLPKEQMPFLLLSPFTGLTRTYGSNGDYSVINTTEWHYGSGEGMLMNEQLTLNVSAAPFVAPMAYWERFDMADSKDSVRFTFVVGENADDMDATRIIGLRNVQEQNENGEFVTVEKEVIYRLYAGVEVMDGDKVLVTSNSMDYPFFYALTADRFGGAAGGVLDFMPSQDTTIMIASPVQGRLFMASANGVYVCSEIMNFKQTYKANEDGLSWVRLFSVNNNMAGVDGIGYFRNPVHAIAPSYDGDYVLLSVDRQDGTCDLVRVSGLNALDLNNSLVYAGDMNDPNNFTQTVLRTFNRNISSIVCAKEGDEAYITFGGINPNEANVMRLKNVSSDDVTFETIGIKAADQTDVKPVFSILLDAFSNKAYIGTDDGMYETEDRNNPSWTKVTSVPNVPIYDLYQQTANLPTVVFTSFLGNNATENVFEGTQYPGAIYAASYGKGLFMNRDDVQPAQDSVLVGLQDVAAMAQTTMKLYPNPAANMTTLNYTLATASNVTMAVYDMNGRQISVLNKGSQSAGVHSQVIDLRSMSKGVYVIRIMTNNSVSTAKLIVQ